MTDIKLKLDTPEEAETVFYEAFRHGDQQVMTALWSDKDVICIHPGSGAIVGHEAVVRGWKHIFHNAAQPSISYTVTQRIITDELMVRVTYCYSLYRSLLNVH